MPNARATTTKKSTKIIPEVKNQSDSESEMPTTTTQPNKVEDQIEEVEEVENNNSETPVKETRKRTTIVKQMTPEFENTLTQIKEFVESGKMTDADWAGLTDLVSIGAKNAPQKHTTKMSAAVVDGIHTHYKESEKEMREQNKVKASRKKTTTRINGAFEITHEFAAVLEKYGDLENKDKKKVSDLISLIENPKDGKTYSAMSKTEALSAVWTIFGSCLKTSKNTKNEASFPYIDGELAADWSDKAVFDGLPKELKALLKGYKDKNVEKDENGKKTDNITWVPRTYVRLSQGQNFVATKCLVNPDKEVGKIQTSPSQ